MALMYILCLCCAYTKYMQESIEEYGVIISSNGHNSIKVEDARDHQSMPSYPETSIEDIAYFIHFNKLLITSETSKDEVIKIITRQMSNIS